MAELFAYGYIQELRYKYWISLDLRRISVDQLLKYHGSYQQDNRENRRPGKSKDWQMMLRLRNPGGEVPGKLF